MIKAYFLRKNNKAGIEIILSNERLWSFMTLQFVYTENDDVFSTVTPFSLLTAVFYLPYIG